MFAPLFAVAMLAAFSQQHTTRNDEAPPPADALAADAAANGEATEAVEEAAEEAAEAAEEAAAEAADAAAEAAAEAGGDEAEVCHRRTFYDEFGRRRSRRVCTPR